MGYYDLLGELADQVNQWNAFNVLAPKYGAKGDGVTDDTSAVQAAINAASAKAVPNQLVDVWLPPGYGFKLSQLAPAPGVRLRCYGAVIIPNLAGINQALLHYATANSLSGFAICGGLWQGTGTEGSGANQQALFDMVSGSGCSDILFRDMVITNWASGPLYMRNPLRARALDNTLLTVGANKTINSINFVVDGTLSQGQTIMARGNTVDGSQCAAIAYVNTQDASPTEVRLDFSDNICTGVAGGNDISGAIDVEFNGAAAVNFTRFRIAGNHVTNPGTGNGSNYYGISVGGGGGNATVSEALIEGNTVHVLDAAKSIGIATYANPDITIRDNRISATIPIQGTGPPFKTGNKYSSGPASGRATLVAGTVTVNTAEVVAGDNIILSRMVAGGTLGELSVGTITAGTSFVINSSSGTDTSTVYWKIDH